KSTLDTWSNPNNAKVGTHFLIDKNGTIYQCASLHKYTQHVGDIKVKNLDINNENYKNKIYKGASSVEKEKQYPNRYPINSDSIGIEVVSDYKNNKFGKKQQGSKKNQLRF
ncbi:N-acetylmuramoyl-L-alanine amidase, partial [Helicobacter sp. MIT 05-5294]|uniref:N-acetylmuramoyl-L-alanine amidase n=1 Tax=Helicobacter sp. MIT 05-5294 TaxID=1548150 RepID=UPI001EE8102B